MVFTSKQRQQLKARAHALKPVVLFGARGLTPAVIAETDQALTAHELIKVKLIGEDKPNVAKNLAEQTQAEIIQIIGHVATLYRENHE